MKELTSEEITQIEAGRVWIKPPISGWFVGYQDQGYRVTGLADNGSPIFQKIIDNVTHLPQRDLIAEMKGPDRLGNDVILKGRLVPKMVMYVREGRDEVEFCLDGRVMFGFPRAQAWDAAAFAFAAMAVGAGCDPLNFEPTPFAKNVVSLGDLPEKI